MVPRFFPGPLLPASRPESEQARSCGLHVKRCSAALSLSPITNIVYARRGDRRAGGSAKERRPESVQGDLFSQSDLGVCVFVRVHERVEAGAAERFDGEGR